MQELKDELKALGLTIQGNKADLAKRLEEALTSGTQQGEQEADIEPPKDEATITTTQVLMIKDHMNGIRLNQCCQNLQSWQHACCNQRKLSKSSKFHASSALVKNTRLAVGEGLEVF